MVENKHSPVNKIFTPEQQNVFKPSELSLPSLLMAGFTYHLQTVNHGFRTSDFAILINRYISNSPFKDDEAVGANVKYLSDLRIGTFLHDIGKMGCDGESLYFKAQLTDEENEDLKKHPEYGLIIVDKMIPFSSEVIRNCIIQHHENMDGSGYPNHLKGEEISMEGAITAVADSFDAQISKRHYREPVGIDEAMEDIIRGRNRLYHPVVVDALIELVKIDRLSIENVREMHRDETDTLNVDDYLIAYNVDKQN